MPLWKKNDDGEWVDTNGQERERWPEPQFVLELTLTDVCKLLSDSTGEEITEKTHWIRTGMETGQALPYGRVRIEAFPRSEIKHVEEKKSV